MIMKRLFLLIVPLTLSLSVAAQTYKNGTWYSLYDDSEHTMNTQGDYETGGVFAPTAGKLNVKWRYEWIDWFGVARKIDTDVLESSNGGSSTKNVGSLKENTSNNSNTTESFNLSTNINWIKFNRSGVPTHKVHVYHIDIPLKKHILLASGDYGTTSATHDFGGVEVLSVSEPYIVNLRSFLSAGDITVTSSNPELFHIGSADNTEPIVYAVGNGACASANGKAAAAGGSALGNIANYSFPVYFTPQVGGEYEATVTLTDGTSTATLTVKGTALRFDQTITWDEEKTEMLSNDTIEAATASSKLPVNYTFEPEGIVAFVDGQFTIIGDGRVTITAVQEGNGLYNSSNTIVKTFDIHPAVSKYSYTAKICESDVYSDDNFANLTESGEYVDTIPTVFGGDSIITLTLSVNKLFASEETRSVFYVGTDELWNGINLGALPLGDTTLVVEYASASGCDSTYTLHLAIVERPTTYGADTLYICAGEKVEYEGVVYRRPTEKEILLAGRNCYGGDSIVSLVVYVRPVMKMAEEQTITAGDMYDWHDYDLSIIPAGDTVLVAQYTSVYGCDSIYTLHLSVVSSMTVDVHNTDAEKMEEQQKFFHNGHMYIRREGKVYNVTGVRVD